MDIPKKSTYPLPLRLKGIFNMYNGRNKLLLQNASSGFDQSAFETNKLHS